MRARTMAHQKLPLISKRLFSGKAAPLDFEQFHKTLDFRGWTSVTLIVARFELFKLLKIYKATSRRW